MKRLIHRRWKLIITLCMALAIGGAFFIRNVAMAETQDFYFYYINSADNNNKIKITEYTIEKPSMVIHLNSDSGIFDSDEISWKVEDPSILTITPNVGTGTSATITCVKPGTSKVWAEIKRPVDGDYQIFSAECIFTVRLAINDYVNTPGNQGKIIHLFDEDPDDCGSLVIDVNESFNLGLKIGQAQAQDLSWTSLNKNIADIDDSGKVVGIQPGIAKILAQTYDLANHDNILQTDYIYVVVRPKFKGEDGQAYKTVTLSNPEVLKTNISDYISTDEEIETRNASEFVWIVKNADTNEVLANTYTKKTSPLVSITPSKVDGTAAIDCKSGNYTVEVYPIYKDPLIDVMAAENYIASKAKITEYVDIKLLTDADYVQVNDVWDLYKISNIYNIAEDFDINVTNCEYSKLKGTITFDKQGIAMVQFKRKYGSKLPLDNAFSDGVLTVYINVKPYTVQTNQVRVKMGGAARVSVSDYGYDASQYGIAYEYAFLSNNEKIATVYSNTPKSTDIRGITPGSTTVDCKISYSNGITRKLTWNVSVWKKISATLDVTQKKITIGTQFTIQAKYPTNTNPDSDINVQWVNVTNDKTKSPIKIINEDTNDYSRVSVLGVSEGVGSIALMDLNDSEDAEPLAVCYITVVKNTEIAFSQTEYSVVLQNDTSKNNMVLNLIYSPEKPEFPKVVWDSTNKSVATVENGLVTYKSAGLTDIVATYYAADGISVSKSCRLTVYQKIDSVSITQKSIKLNTGDVFRLEANYTPNNTVYMLPEDRILSWKADDESVVQVDKTGSIINVKALRPGKTTIKVITTSGEESFCSVEVIQLPTSVSFPDKTITMDVGDKKKLSAAVAPLTATDTNVEFTSSMEDYLAIDKDGLATAKSAGPNGKTTVYVYAKTSNGKNATLPVVITQRVDDMSIISSEKTLAKGSTFALNPTITPSNAYNKGVTYKSSNSRVANVTTNGVVRAVSGGSTIITCTSNDTGLTKYCLITVVEKASSVSLNQTSYVIGVGKTYTLKATVKSNFATNTKVKWKSSNSKIATVTQNGVIKGIKPGYVTITATSQDGSGVYATCRVRVIRQVSSIKLNKASAQIVAGNSVKLVATVTPTNATLKTVKWTSSNEQVAYVDSVGKVVAVEAGRCTIKATTNDGSQKSASCIIEVIDENPITTLTIVNKNITLAVGESARLNSYVAPKRNTDNVRWYSDDTRIVSINSKTGKMKANRTGTATITLASSSGKSTTTTVTVVGLNRSSLTMEQYDTYQLRVINGRTVQWDSSNYKIVNVNRTGKLSARKKGTTYVTAIVNGRKIRCKVKVKNIK